MSDPRILGLTLMTISSAAFLGTTSNTLPPVTFFPALALFALGAIRFLKSNHEALKRAEDKAHQDVNPARRQARIDTHRRRHSAGQNDRDPSSVIREPSTTMRTWSLQREEIT